MDLEKALTDLDPIPRPKARIPPIKRCAVITMDQIAITDATSEKPVLTSWGASSCFVIFAYDRERRRLGILHTSGLDSQVNQMIAAVRENDDKRPIGIFIAGRGNTRKTEENTQNRDANLLVRHLSERVPNAILKHADILNKNGLIEDHAMDARTGDFFFLKNDRKSLTRNDLMRKSASISGNGLVFDGTWPENQRKDLGRFTARRNKEKSKDTDRSR